MQVKMVTKLEVLGWAGFLLYITSLIQVGDLSLEPTHACNTDKELKAYCYDLSDSKVTCYTQPEKTGGKQCRGGEWKVIPKVEETPQIEYKSPSGEIHCTSKGCS